LDREKLQAKKMPDRIYKLASVDIGLGQQHQASGGDHHRHVVRSVNGRNRGIQK